MASGLINTRPDRLDHIALVSSQPEAAAEHLAGVLGLPVVARSTAWAAGCPAIQVGRTWLEFYPAGHPQVGETAREGLHHLGLATPDPAASFVECREAGLVSESAIAGGGTGDFLDLSRTGGVPIHFVAALESDRPATVGESGVERLDHIGVAAADNGIYQAVFSDQFGFPIESTQTDSESRIPLETMVSDKYGVVYHTRQPELQGALRAVFITVGDCELECLQDLSRASSGVRASAFESSTKRDQSAIARFVETRGPGLHHLAFKVADLDRALAHAKANGAVPLDDRSRPGGRRSQIAFFHPKSVGGVLIHFVQREPL